MDKKQILKEMHPEDKHHHDIDIKNLQKELEKRIKGEVRFDEGNRALYATDGSNYRMEPIGVVIPRDREDVINTVNITASFKAPLLSRGGGTSLAGQCTNHAVVMDLSKYYHGILEINKAERTVRVLPGTVLDIIRTETEKQGLTFGPDPSTHNHCAIGGMIGNNSCGIHSVLSAKYNGARTSDNIRDMEIMTYDGEIFRVGETSEEELEKIIAEGGRRGEIYASLKEIRDQYADEIRKRFPDIPRRVSGYNIDDLLPEKKFNVARALTGTEGTCVVILEATLQLVPHPPKRGLLVLGYNDIFKAGHVVPEIMQYDPVGLEGIDQKLVDFMHSKHLREENLQKLPEGHGWLLAEFGGETKEEVKRKLDDVVRAIKKRKNAPYIDIYDVGEEEELVWKIRESGLGATAFVKGQDDAWPGWEDSAVPPEKVGSYLEDLRDLFKKFNYQAALYGHFGQGCIHCRINFNLVDQEGLEKYRKFVSEATDLVKKYGGSYSGEHGDGQARGQFLEKMYGPKIIEAFRKFKYTWDPENMMNPGKVIDPYPTLAHLRLGTGYEPWKGKTYYKYPNDQGRFSRAVLRCVGVGKCRREGGGTMCPSYMVTREEMHSTRGRAHLLFELTRGNIISSWKNKTIKESLDLCLSCKGCKDECPVSVDVATYKSEFLAHYYKGRLRPMHAYVFGLIAFWSRIGSKMPRLANWSLHAPLISSIIKRIAGIAQQREMPPFADETYKHWFFTKIKNNPPSADKKLIFWADTFNNYFHTHVAKAATRVLLDAGWHIIVPKTHLCCGRPLYDYGMMNTAKKWLREILTDLRDEIRAGTPLVGIEPSCMATFRDELVNIFPDDEDAKRLSRQSYLFSEFFQKIDKDYKLPEIKRKAIVHGHCQHKAIFGMESEVEMLKKMKVDYRLLDSGCCGMAGAFGFEKKKYDISVKAGERVLLPEVRKTNGELVIANGFSCKEQIKQLTPKNAQHIAEVIDQEIRKKGGTKFPE